MLGWAVLNVVFIVTLWWGVRHEATDRNG